MSLFRRLAAAFRDPQISAVASANAFALDLYRALGGEQRGNLFFSPFNIATALAMAASGARGQTAAEMRKTLHLTLTPERVDAELGGALQMMMAGREAPPPEAEEAAADPPGSEPGQPRRRVERQLFGPPPEPARLSFANAVWLASDLALEARYERSMTTHYDGGLRRIDFEADQEAARQMINQWVATQTGDRIRNLFGRPLRGPMVLTAAIYLKADWEIQFATPETKNGDFHIADGSTAPARLMHKQAIIRYMEGDGFQAIALPYRGDDLSMMVFLPRAHDGLAAFEQALDASKLERLLGRLRAAPRQTVSLILPKIRLDGDYDLKAILAGLGMRRAFTEQADFAGINRNRALMIEGVAHKSFLAVDEEGTEAAAATGLRVVPTSAHIRPRSVEFRADHPFLFVVRDERTGAILFMGRLERP